MAKLIGYIIQVEADESRDLDQQMENLRAIECVESVDFQQGWYGDQSYWKVECRIPADMSRGLFDLFRRMDKAVKTRKSKNVNSKVLHADYARHMDSLNKQAASHPMGFYLSHVE